MIPAESVLREAAELPSYTYKLSEDSVRGYVDELEAVKQAIYKILMTERYKYVIYGFNYGIELDRVMGKGKSFAKAVLPGIIKEALCADGRISDVGDFEFSDIDKESLKVKFAVQTDFGEISAEVRCDV
ncbi:MAG: DUF2634 domain-containing protein [Clostridiales bacterium]|nr:DUF2634 domain-containing protein [Clostridiales bacterium]